MWPFHVEQSAEKAEHTAEVNPAVCSHNSSVLAFPSTPALRAGLQASSRDAFRPSVSITECDDNNPAVRFLTLRLRANTILIGDCVMHDLSVGATHRIKDARYAVYPNSCSLLSTERRQRLRPPSLQSADINSDTTIAAAAVTL